MAPSSAELGSASRSVRSARTDWTTAPAWPQRTASDASRIDARVLHTVASSAAPISANTTTIDHPASGWTRRGSIAGSIPALELRARSRVRLAGTVALVVAVAGVAMQAGLAGAGLELVERQHAVAVLVHRLEPLGRQRIAHRDALAGVELAVAVLVEPAQHRLVALGALGLERVAHRGALGVVELAVAVLVELLDHGVVGRAVAGQGKGGCAGNQRRGDQQCEFQLGQHGFLRIAPSQPACLG